LVSQSSIDLTTRNIYIIFYNSDETFTSVFSEYGEESTLGTIPVSDPTNYEIYETLQDGEMWDSQYLFDGVFKESFNRDQVIKSVAAPLHDQQGYLVGFVLLTWDIQPKVSDEMITAQVGELAYEVSKLIHEFER
jgi:hypothetical protein